MKRSGFSTPILILLFFLSIACGPPDASAPDPPALSEEEIRLPENALRGVSVAEGLEVQLFASEPMVRNPANIDVDHRGRVWVVENVNYRPENNPDNPYQDGGDMVVILEDTDGDGRADDRKVFFQDLLVDGAMGIGVFGNRVYLSSSPHLLVLTDEDGDDRADRVDTLFTGMGDKQGDHTVHAVSFGPDGRLYFNYGNASPGMLHKDGAPVVDKMGNRVEGSGTAYQQGMIFRCEMDGSQVESLAYNFRNNYEVCVDSYGRMWQSDNDDDGNKACRINYVMEYGNYGYRDELTREAWQVNRSGMHPEIPSRHWHQNDPGVVPNLYITGSGSPCGIMLYEGDLLPEKYRGQLFHADAGPGVVRALFLEDDGAGFRAREEAVLVRRADSWFRPTDVSTAPDGSIFIADWYDPGVGGHWAGDAMRGRIFRVAPSVRKYEAPASAFDSASDAAAALENPNPATRYLAWTALEKAGKEAEKELAGMWRSANPVCRARALWLLGRIDRQYVITALEDEDPKIRATAVRVARQLYPDQLTDMLGSRVSDTAPGVLRETAVALRELEADPQTVQMWAHLANRYDGNDRWFLEALGIGAMDKWDACFEAWRRRAEGNWNSPAGRDIVWRSRSRESFSLLVEILKDPGLTPAEQGKFLRATDFVSAPDKDQRLAELIRVDRPGKSEFLQMLLTHMSPEFAANSQEIAEVVRELLPLLRGGSRYLDLVGQLQLAEEAPYLLQLALENPDHELGVRAAQTLVELKGWEPFQKAVGGEHQLAVITLMANINQGPAKALLKSVAIDEQAPMSNRKKAIAALGVDWGWEARITNLLENEDLPDELVRVAATSLLNATRPVDRNRGLEYLDALGQGQKAIASIQVLLEREGDPARGREVFTTYCATCHQIYGEGTEFGPNLSEIANKLGRDGLYSSILFPNAAISHGFEGVHIEKKDKAHLVGYLLSGNAEKLELKIMNGSIQSIPKTEIAVMEDLDHSLMPAGLAETMGEDDLVHLVTFLSTLKNEETKVSNPYQGKILYERTER